MKFAPFLLVLLLAAGIARADIVIVQKVDGAGQTGQMTVKVGTDKVRTDVNTQLSTITDVNSGDVTTIMHAQKAYMIVSASTTRAMMDQMKKVMQTTMGTTVTTPAAPKATGKTDKINGYNAAEYTFANGNMKATYWISSDFPNTKGVMAALAKFQKGSLADMTKSFAPDLSTLPGVPVKTEVDLNGQKIVTELVSATDQAVEPADYQVPAGYTEMKMPTMPTQ